MNIRTYTAQETIFATTRLRLPREVNASMDGWNKMAHYFHAKVTFIPGMERPVGPLGNYMQTLTVTIEGDCDDPKCQQLFDAIYSNDPKKLEQIKMELRSGSLTDDASNTTNAVDQSTARNTQKHAAPLNRAIAVNSSDTAPLIKRIFMFLEDGEWDRVYEYCETVLDLDPENAHAYLGMLMAELKVSHVKDLKDQAESFAENKNYQKAVRYADEKLKAGLIGCINHINTRNENERLEGLYISAIEELNTVSNSEKNVSEQSIKKIAEQFESISHYKDAADKARECYKRIEEIRLEKKRQEEIARIEDEQRAREQRVAKRKVIKVCMIVAPIVVLLIAVVLLVNNRILNSKYNDAVALMDAGKYEDSIAAFETLDGYKDSADRIAECNTIILDDKYNDAIALMDAGRYEDAITAFEALDGYKDSEERAEMNRLKSAKVGDYVTFGRYEQDNYTTNGKEKIEWLVLDKQDNRLLLISKDALNCNQFNTTDTGITWENCTLREWLNNDFINSAFSTAEKAMIPTITVLTDKNPEYSTAPGNSTQDQVFLLSIAEANKYFRSNTARQCEPTDYADANGAWDWWWLRSPGFSQNTAAYVDDVGEVVEFGEYVYIGSYAVRPALWITLES